MFNNFGFVGCFQFATYMVVIVSWFFLQTKQVISFRLSKIASRVLVVSIFLQLVFISCVLVSVIGLPANLFHTKRLELF